MSEIKIPVGEALRYMRAANADPETRQLAEDTAKMLEERLQPRYLWRACRIDRTGGEVSLPGSDRQHSLSDGFAFVGFTSRGRQ